MIENELINKLLILKEKIIQLQKDNSSLREKNYNLELKINQLLKSDNSLVRKPINDHIMTIKKHNLGDINMAINEIQQNKVTKKYRIGTLSEREKIRYVSFIESLYKNAKIENNRYILNNLKFVKDNLLMTNQELNEIFNKLNSMTYNNIPLFEIKDDVLTSIIKPETIINYISEEI